jgi:hypothetical protein
MTLSVRVTAGMTDRLDRTRSWQSAIAQQAVPLTDAAR